MNKLSLALCFTSTMATQHTRQQCDVGPKLDLIITVLPGTDNVKMKLSDVPEVLARSLQSWSAPYWYL